MRRGIQKGEEKGRSAGEQAGKTRAKGGGRFSRFSSILSVFFLGSLLSLAARLIGPLPSISFYFAMRTIRMPKLGQEGQGGWHHRIICRHNPKSEETSILLLVPALPARILVLSILLFLWNAPWGNSRVAWNTPPALHVTEIRQSVFSSLLSSLLVFTRAFPAHGSYTVVLNQCRRNSTSNVLRGAAGALNEDAPRKHVVW